MFLVQRLSDNKFYKNPGPGVSDPEEEKNWFFDPNLCRPFFTKSGAKSAIPMRSFEIKFNSVPYPRHILDARRRGEHSGLKFKHKDTYYYSTPTRLYEYKKFEELFKIVEVRYELLS